MYVIIAIIAAGFALFYCSYQIRLGAYVRSLCRNRAAGRVVALTFDDGPDPEQTPRVLDTLRAHGVRATFFLIGSKAELHPEIVRRMAAEGHAIGIHTWSHTPGFPMLRSGAMAADILRCRESLREITGVETDLFRPPYGVTNPMVARAVKRTGSRCVGWSIRSLDTLRQRSRGTPHPPTAGRRQGDPAARRPPRCRTATGDGAERPATRGLPHGDRMRTV